METEQRDTRSCLLSREREKAMGIILGIGLP
jgi:hypothetical protein